MKNRLKVFNTEGDMTIKATQEDTHIKGSQVTGENVTLEAKKNIAISAAENSNTTKENTKSSGASIGASIGVGGLQGISASYGKANGHVKENETTYEKSQVTANKDLIFSSVKNTTITESEMAGGKVTGYVGGNLSIETKQDQKNYEEKNSSTGLSVNYSMKNGKTSISGGISKDYIHSNYESATGQAGIRAKEEGFDISVKDNTDLKGGVIDSAASKDKNTLTTGTLRWEDKENKADYKAGGMGVSYSPNDKSSKLNQRGLTPNLTPTVKDNADSTTKSAVAEGTIHITNKEKQKQDIASLNRDTKNSLNQLQEIFDKTKVEERQELVGMLEKYGNQAIYTYAESKGWKDGSTEKMLLHGAFGALMGDMAGGSAATGALSGGVNEYVMGYLTKTKGKEWVQKHPDTVQWLSAGVGAAIGNLSKDVLTSTMVSLNAAKWNYLGFDLTTEPLLKRTLKKDDGQTLTDQEWHQLSNALMDIADQADPFGSDLDSLEVGNEFAKETVRQYLIEHGFTTDSTEKFMDSYEFWASDLQERQNHDNFYDLPLVRATADSIKDASDSKYIKYAINGADYVIDGLHIIESDYPGDAAYAWVVGAETAYIVGSTLNLSGKYMGLAPKYRLLGSGIIGGLAGNSTQEKVENELQNERNKGENNEKENNEERK